MSKPMASTPSTRRAWSVARPIPLAAPGVPAVLLAAAPPPWQLSAIDADRLACHIARPVGRQVEVGSSNICRYHKSARQGLCSFDGLDHGSLGLSRTCRDDSRRSQRYSVRTQPGQTAFTQMPRGPSSFAHVFVRPMMACLEQTSAHPTAVLRHVPKWKTC